MRSTGSQPANWYGLAKLHKKDTTLRPRPRSSYENLNKKLAQLFDKLEGANIETNLQEAREILEKVILDCDEIIFSLDVMLKVCTLMFH